MPVWYDPQTGALTPLREIILELSSQLGILSILQH